MWGIDASSISDLWPRVSGEHSIANKVACATDLTSHAAARTLAIRALRRKPWSTKDATASVA
jgi:hypothetical protein